MKHRQGVLQGRWESNTPHHGPLVSTSVQRRDGAVTVLAVAGDIDVVTAPTLAESLRAARALGGAALIVDLAHVEFMGSAGLRVFGRRASRHFGLGERRGGRRGHRDPTSPPGDRFDDLLDIFLTPDSALEAARRSAVGP